VPPNLWKIGRTVCRIGWSPLAVSVLRPHRKEVVFSKPLTFPHRSISSSTPSSDSQFQNQIHSKRLYQSSPIPKCRKTPSWTSRFLEYALNPLAQDENQPCSHDHRNRLCSQINKTQRDSDYRQLRCIPALVHVWERLVRDWLSQELA